VEEVDDTPKTEEEIAALVADGTLMVCVPADVVSLRRKPGPDSTVITELKAGTQVVWDGTKLENSGTTYYKVVVLQSGQQGYLPANYCVKVDFDVPDALEELQLVETDTALYTYDMMVEDIEALAAQYPDRISQRVIGSSRDGRDLYEVVLGNADAENHILVQGAIHGREYMTAQLLMKMIEYYAYYYDTGSYHDVSYRDLLDRTAIHVVPMSNPDGVTISQLGASALNDPSYEDLVYECYERDKEYLEYTEDSLGYGSWSDHYSEEGFDRSGLDDQRVITYEEYQQIWKANAAGVDLNNNFDAGWSEMDLKEYPSYGSYKGTSAVSEPEAQALVNLALERDYQYFISYHSKGQLIYYDVKGNDSDTSERSQHLANMLRDSLNYETVNTQKGYNVNLGGFSDWLQLSLKQTSVTVESGRMPCPLSIEEFPGLWYRHRESWAMLMKDLYE
jgi:g-D-glutamyl-meso-diaminopimelate peptidase